MNDIRILIVEEDPTVQFATAELARKFDYETDLVSSIDDALNFVSQTQYAAVLINTEMDSVDGFACTDRIRDLERLRCERVPIIGIRTGVGAAVKQVCIDADMDDVLPRPFSGEELRQALLRWAYQSCHPNQKLAENPTVFGFGTASPEIGTISRV